VGLNDMSLAYGHRFMFKLLADGTVDRLAEKFQKKGLPFGFGGIAAMHGGLLPGSYVLKEHYRLGSSRVILSRSFCNAAKIDSLQEIEEIFQKGVREIRGQELLCQTEPQDYVQNHRIVCEKVDEILQMQRG